jgi:hypothetical protein
LFQLYYASIFGLLIPESLALSEEAYAGFGIVVWDETYKDDFPTFKKGDVIFSTSKNKMLKPKDYSDRQLLHISVAVDNQKIIDATPENGSSLRTVEEFLKTHRPIRLKRTELVKRARG